jgi:hypothetical protein
LALDLEVVVVVQERLLLAWGRLEQEVLVELVVGVLLWRYVVILPFPVQH